MIHIDGAEGGGAVVRVAVGLSIATHQPVRVKNIRKNRPNRGLQTQHLAGVRAAAQLADAELVGAETGSTRLTFVPNTVKTRRTIRAEVATAGSVGLTLQPVQIAMMSNNHGIHVVVDGGATAGKWAPPVPYLQHVATPILERIGYTQAVEVRRHGFYPVGGALTHAMIGPGPVKPLQATERDAVVAVKGVSIAASQLKEVNVAERQRREARRILVNAHPAIDIDIATRSVDAPSSGSVIVLWAVTEDGHRVGADMVGEKGKRAEIVGKEAAEQLRTQIESGAPVDEWMADQLVPALALAGGELRVPRLTDHIRTNIRVAKRFVDGSWTVDEAGNRIAVSRA